MGVRSDMARYYRSLGPRGALAVCSYHLFRRPREIAAYPAGISNPVYLRLLTTDVQTYKYVFLEREYAFDLPFSPATIIDAGANIGMASVYFAHTYPQSRIIAIEPEDSNFDMLAKNVRLYRNVMPMHAALWNHDGEIGISEAESASGETGKWACVTYEGAGSKVRAICMQTLLKEFDQEPIDILKMDIEGAEREVFDRPVWMNRIRCLMIELHDRIKPGCSAAVDSATRDFKRYLRGDTTFYLRVQ